MAEPDFWSDPRLQWPGSAAEMRDALLYWIERAPTRADIDRLRKLNNAHLIALSRADFAAVAAAIGRRIAELRKGSHA